MTTIASIEDLIGSLKKGEASPVKVLKKKEIMARKESAKRFSFSASADKASTDMVKSAASLFGGPKEEPKAPASVAGVVAPGLSELPPEARLAGEVRSGGGVSVQMLKGEPEVQLVEVEAGVYDIYISCGGEQFIVRCESLAKAAQVPA